MPSSCPSCCHTCVTELLLNFTDNFDSNYSLSNFLPAGTIEIDVSKYESCEHFHTEDGWHKFRGQALIRNLIHVEDDEMLCQDLDFLISHQFISASCRLGSLGLTLYVRIYIIPYDLLHVSGKLRVRSADVLKPTRRSMRLLLPRISQDVGSWEGDDRAPRSADARPFIRQDGDSRTLAEIYGDLSSPVVEASSNRRVNRITSPILSGEGPDGLRSDLYTYQRHSVVAMIQRELNLEDIPDPLYIPIVGMKDSKTFYLQPATMEILWDRPMVAPTRGGVLCEELGTGKTVMILALVLATLDELSSPEESILEARPAMTQLAFRHFPSSDFETARAKALRGQHKTRFPHGPTVPSLVELLLHRIRILPYDVRRYEEDLEDRKLLHPLRANVPFYHIFGQEPIDNERRKRRKSEPQPQMLLLTAATIIVVPANLIGQWSREIHKHCHSLRFLILRSTTPMPRAKELASDYDIILMTYHRFSNEAKKKNNVTDLRTLKPCTCPEYDGWRIPKCQCKDLPSVSPLLQVRWKRLLIDEGHVAGTLSTNLTPFVKSLSVERLWIVTGTPTRNLLGLSFGQNADAQREETEETEDESQSDFSENIPPQPSVDGPIIPRRWTKYDREDLNKLAIMTTDFIGVPHFKKEPNFFKTHITNSLVGPEKPHFGAIQVLTQVMNMVMIRHRIEDVEDSIVLPPIKQETILLDMDPYAVKAYNCLQAGIVINAIDSQRTDQDYFFHPRNRKELLQVVENMSQLMFWSVDANLYGIVQIVQESEEHLKTAVDRKTPIEDLRLLQDAIMHVRSAEQDHLWRAMQTHEDVPYRVFNMDHTVFDAWSRIPASRESATAPHSIVGFIHPDRLVRMRSMVIGRPLISMGDMVEWGCAVSQKDREQRRLYEESLLSDPKKDKRSKTDSKTPHESGNGQTTAVRRAKKVAAGEKLKEIRQELQTALKRLDEIQNEESEDTAVSQMSLPVRLCAVDANSPKAQLLSSSPLARVRVGSSASTKVDYILNEILHYASHEKFLVFSKSALSLAHVAEGLELLQVKYLQFTTNVLPQVREQVVMTFETSETYRVFLMELKHGARGLNLISASRVIFCEPVWQADVESQAIKRVHRIGQARPVSVKTLAIRSTAEENMVARRNALKGMTAKLPDLIEEQGMRHFIEHPKFINYEPTLLSTLDIPLIDLSNTRTDESQTSNVTVTNEKSHPSTSRVSQRDGEIDETASVSNEALPKKKKTAVRFLSVKATNEESTSRARQRDDEVDETASVRNEASPKKKQKTAVRFLD